MPLYTHHKRFHQDGGQFPTLTEQVSANLLSAPFNTMDAMKAVFLLPSTKEGESLLELFRKD